MYCSGVSPANLQDPSGNFNVSLTLGSVYQYSRVGARQSRARWLVHTDSASSRATLIAVVRMVKRPGVAAHLHTLLLRATIVCALPHQYFGSPVVGRWALLGYLNVVSRGAGRLQAPRMLQSRRQSSCYTSSLPKSVGGLSASDGNLQGNQDLHVLTLPPSALMHSSFPQTILLNNNDTSGNASTTLDGEAVLAALGCTQSVGLLCSRHV